MLNIIGLNIGKVAAERGGRVDVSSADDAGGMWRLSVASARVGDAFHVAKYPADTGIWATVNFWPQIAFAFAGMELVLVNERRGARPSKDFSARSFRVGRVIAVDLHRRDDCGAAHVASGVVDPKSGVFQALTIGFAMLGIAFFGIIAAMLVTVGNAGGVGSTVAGIARVPFVVGIDRYLPRRSEKFIRNGRRLTFRFWCRRRFRAEFLLLIQVNETTVGAYQVLVDCDEHSLFHSVFVHVWRGDQACVSQQIARECAGGGADSRRTRRRVDRGCAGTHDGACGDCVVVDPAGRSDEQMEFEMKLWAGRDLHRWRLG